MTRTTEQQKQINEYKKYTKGIRNAYKNTIRGVKELRSSIIKRARDSPAGQKNVVRNRLLEENRKALNPPKWTTYMMTIDAWSKTQTLPTTKTKVEKRPIAPTELKLRREYRYAIKNEERERMEREKRKTIGITPYRRRIIERRKIVKDIIKEGDRLKMLRSKRKKVGTTAKHYNIIQEHREVKETKRFTDKDLRQLIRWADRFQYRGRTQIPDKINTTMDDVVKYQCYLRWSDDAHRDQFLKILPRMIRETKGLIDLGKDRRVRLLWEYFDDIKHPKETKWASTPTYTDNWDKLMKDVLDITHNNGDIYEGLYSTVINVHFYIGDVVIPFDFGEGVARSIKIAERQFYEVSDKTEYNCQYASVYRGINNDYKSENVVKPSWDLKNKILKLADLKTGGNYDTLQLLSNYKQITIKVYNNSYTLINTIIPVEKADSKRKRKVNTIEIRINDHHWTALFRYRDIDIEAPKDDEEITKAPEDKLGDSELIKAKSSLFNPSKLDSKIATYDLETTKDANGKCVVYMAGVSVPKGEVEIGCEDIPYEYKQWILDVDSENPLKDMVHFMIEEHPNHTYYAHYGSKFDLNFVLNEILPDNKYSITGNTELNGRWLNLKVATSNDKHKFIIFRDSWCLLQNSLDECTKKFKVKHQKLTETVCHDDINLNNYKDKLDELSKYLHNDNVGLLEVLFKFRDIVWETTLKTVRTYKRKVVRKGGKSKSMVVEDAEGQPMLESTQCGINITNCFTLASLAKKGFFRNFYNDSYNKPKFPLYYLNKLTDKYVRNSYSGGRVECHFMGEVIGKIRYYDFTSLFPAMMVKDLPYGQPRFMASGEAVKKQLDNGYFFGFIRCIVKQINTDYPPIHCVKLNHKGEVVQKGGKLTFPIIETPTELTLFSEELVMGMESGMYEYEILDGMKFKRGKCMKEYVEHLYKLKCDSSATGCKPNPVLRQIAKIWVNSSYGFWGLRAFDREGCSIDKNNNIWKMKYEQNKLVNCGKVGEYYISRYIEDIPIKELNVGLASAITSYARMRIWQLVKDIIRSGGDIYYLDTDSIMTNSNLEELTTLDYERIVDEGEGTIYDSNALMDEFVPDGTGAELGSLKNEAHDVGCEYFDKLYVGGKKLYCLEYTDKHGKTQIKKSCKGFSFIMNDNKMYFNKKTKDSTLKDPKYEKTQLTYNHFKNEEIVGRQFNMICGRSRFVSETDNFNTYFSYNTKKIVNKCNGVRGITGVIPPIQI